MICKGQSWCRCATTHWTCLNPDNPLGGSASLRERWRTLCGQFCRLLVANGTALWFMPSEKTEVLVNKFLALCEIQWVSKCQLSIEKAIHRVSGFSVTAAGPYGVAPLFPPATRLHRDIPMTTVHPHQWHMSSPGGVTRGWRRATSVG